MDFVKNLLWKLQNYHIYKTCSENYVFESLFWNVFDTVLEILFQKSCFENFKKFISKRGNMEITFMKGKMVLLKFW